jgi:hypothetical protein
MAAATASEWSGMGAPLEHDPEKCEAVFRKIMLNEGSKRDAIELSHRAFVLRAV